MHSGAWIGAGFAVQKVLQLGSNLILTRLLFPEAFGLMALATVFLIGIAMFSDIGLKVAVIRDPRGDDPEFLNTAWTIQVARGFLLFVTGGAIAYPISMIYGQPILFPLLAVVSTTAAISGFTSIGAATAERRLDFRIITVIQLTGQIAGVGLLVTIAYFWRSVWALAVANVISTAATVAIGYVMLPKHRHRLALDRQSAKSMIKFGKWILLSTLATYLGGEGLKAIQGALITPAEFGVLAIAYSIASIPNELTRSLSASLGLSVIAETYRHVPSRARVALHALRLRTLGASLLLYTCVIVLADPLIRALYDTRYQDAAHYLVALSLANIIDSLGQGYTAAILAIGKGSTYFFLMAVSAALRMLGMFVGFEISGIIGLLYGISAANILIIVVVWAIAHRASILDFKLDVLFVSAMFLVIFIYNYFNPQIFV